MQEEPHLQSSAATLAQVGGHGVEGITCQRHSSLRKAFPYGGPPAQECPCTAMPLMQCAIAQGTEQLPCPICDVTYLGT